MLTAPIIHSSFSEVGLCDDDTVMIHADAGVAAQMISLPGEKRLGSLIDAIISFFSKGTIVVPTFSYSLTKGEIFDNQTTPSDVGLFTEKFRKLNGVERSCHPIFSVAVYGSDTARFINTRTSDCFGEDTVFDELYKLNAKLICLGCSMNSLTFVHYVEQRLGVGYRYIKRFSGEVICGGRKSKIVTSYFVRDLELVAFSNLHKLKEKTLANETLKQTSLGRFPLLVISARDFFAAAAELIHISPYALIERASSNN